MLYVTKYDPFIAKMHYIAYSVFVLGMTISDPSFMLWLWGTHRESFTGCTKLLLCHCLYSSWLFCYAPLFLAIPCLRHSINCCKLLLLSSMKTLYLIIVNKGLTWNHKIPMLKFYFTITHLQSGGIIDFFILADVAWNVLCTGIKR